VAEWFEYVGNMHMHTPYSDGTAWHAEIAQAAIAAGLDFIIVTDHNIWVDGVERYHENDSGRVMLLVGEEVHDPRRKPQANHFLAYGAESELSPYAARPQDLIDANNAAGGIGFLAHPFEGDLPLINDPNYGWHDWDVSSYQGLEIWNYMSSLKNALARATSRAPFDKGLLGRLMAARVALDPDRYIDGPEEEVLAKWDELLASGERIVAVGNSDAHAWTYRVGPLERVIYPYEVCFTAVNTHILTREPLNGDLAHDKALILGALGAGRCWVGYERPHPTRGFRFTGQGVNRGIMGDLIELDTGATLQVRTPTLCHIRIVHNGRVVAEVENDGALTYIPNEEGAYRVECRLPLRGRPRGWIFSNPIYLY
jgi:hypothetical protein